MGLPRSYRRLLHKARVSEGLPVAKPWTYNKLHAARRKHALLLLDVSAVLEKYKVGHDVTVSVIAALNAVSVESATRQPVVTSVVARSGGHRQT